jgi:tetratricopeptide (TPR) repeat protein
MLPEKYPECLLALWCLAKSYRGQGKYADAAATSARALTLIETFRRPPPDPIYVDILDDYAESLRKLDRAGEAKEYEEKAEALREKQPQNNVAQKTLPVK